MKGTKTFTAPNIFTSDIIACEFLALLNSATYNLNHHLIKIDFKCVTEFSPSLCSPLGAIVDDLKLRNNEVYAMNLPATIQEILQKNHFLNAINKVVVGDDDIKIIKYRTFTLDDAAPFQDYVAKFLLGNPNFPKMSDKLRRNVLKSMLEIFDNAHIHGKCRFVHTCGHYSITEGILRFTLSDLGVTIRKKVNDFHNSGSAMSGRECIQWAVQHGNTTKQGIPGGIGITLIREFLQKNGGKLQIWSSDGYWEEEGTRILALDCRNRVLGTIVSFEFNLNDQKSYILTEEIDPSKIF